MGIYNIMGFDGISVKKYDFLKLGNVILNLKERREAQRKENNNLAVKGRRK
jgi:hypothetical protein